MNFDTQTIVLIAGAVVVLFFPQLKAAAEKLMHHDAPGGPSVPRRTTQSRSVGSEPSDWINDLYALQKVLIANGQKEAADLLAQAMVKIIGAPTTRSTGGRK